ncbi:MAG: hypothetical protein ACFE9R_03930 [Candidatus Hermodarchaeota archaeon]
MIGTLKESSLHASLKQIYKEPGDMVEKPIGKYVIDIVRQNLLIEIQTINFSAIRRKLENLLKSNRVLLIHPVIKDKWIIYLEPSGGSLSQKRKSPQHGSFFNIFKELIYISDLLSNWNLIIEVILIQAEEIRIKDNKGSWRRSGSSIYDRKLLNILDRKIISNPEQLLRLIPLDLEKPFTNRTLSESLNISIRLAQMMTYTLRKMNLLIVVGRIGNSYLFSAKF